METWIKSEKSRNCSMIYHIIRNSKRRSLFKDIIQDVIHSKLGDTCYITSGFFSESPQKSGYLVSSDPSYNNLSFVTNPDKNLSFVLRGSFNKTHNNNLLNFYKALVKAQYRVSLFSTAIKRHEKVFIYEKNGIPLIEIIGSSNLTKNAYGTQNTFNYEADLVIINDENIGKIVNNIININPININAITDNDNEEDSLSIAKIMKLEYSKDNTEDLTSQMIWIRDKLFK